MRHGAWAPEAVVAARPVRTGFAASNSGPYGSSGSAAILLPSGCSACSRAVSVEVHRVRNDHLEGSPPPSSPGPGWHFRRCPIAWAPLIISVTMEPGRYQERTNIMSSRIRYVLAALFVAVTTSCGSEVSDVGTSEPTTTTSTTTTTVEPVVDPTTTVANDSDGSGMIDDQVLDGFADLSAFINETVEYTEPIGRSVWLVPEEPDTSLQFDLFLPIGEWTESYQREGDEIVLSEGISYSFELVYGCVVTSGWLTHVDGSTFQWQPGFPPGGDESGEDCDLQSSDLPAFHNDLVAADNVNLEVVNNTLVISFEGYEATWVPRS